MGAIAKSLERAGYLKPVGDAVQNYFLKKQQEEDFKKLADAYASSQNRIGELNTGFDRNDIAEMEFNVPNTAIPFQKDIKNVGQMSAAEDINNSTNAPMTDYVLGDVLPPEERYKRSSAEVSNFAAQGLLNKNVDTQRLGGLTEVLSALANAGKPKPIEYFNLGPGDERFMRDPNSGETKSVAKREKEKTFDIEGSFENDDTGTIWTFDKNIGKMIDTGIKFERTKNKTEEKKAEEDKTNQEIYNNILASPWVKSSDLINQGLMDKKDTSIGKYGGAYVVRGKDGNARLIFTNEMLENYAKGQVAKAPNKWDRKKNDDNDPLGIR